MSLQTCRFCNAAVNVAEDDDVFVCPYCGKKQTVQSNIKFMLRDAFLMCEEGKFDEANNLYKKVIRREPENARAYLCKLLIELKVKMPEDLAKLTVSFTNNNYYQRALRFADNKLKASLEDWARQAEENHRNAEKASNIGEIIGFILLGLVIAGLGWLGWFGYKYITKPAPDPVPSFVREAFFRLEEGDFKGADMLCQKILDKDSTNFYAHLCRLMIDMKVKKPEELATLYKSFNENVHYIRALRYANKEWKAALQSYAKSVEENKERVRREKENARKNEGGVCKCGNVLGIVIGSVVVLFFIFAGM